MSTKYSYTKEIDVPRLTSEIQAAAITVALDYIDCVGTALDIYFKATLSAGEETTLGDLVTAHVNTPLDEDVITPISEHVDEMNRTFVRVDSRDKHDSTYFTTRGDKWIAVTGEAVGTGDGSETVFNLDNKEIRNLTVYVDGVEETGISLDNSEYVDNNYSSHFCRGVITFDTAPGNGLAITADYEYAQIGGDTDSDLTFDFGADGSNPKTYYLQFADPVHIKDGVCFYQSGELDSRLNVYVVCPAGQYYFDNNGAPALAAAEVVLAHYVVDQPLMGDAPMGVYFDVEARSKAIPSNYKLKVTVDKGSSTTLKGCLRLEINRERTMIL